MLEVQALARARLDAAAWTRNPHLGVSLIAASAATTIAVSFAGPSAVALDPGERTSALPPWYLPAGAGTPHEVVAVVLLWLGLVAGTIGLWIAWRAVAAGWRPDNRKLLGLGIGLSILTALVLPLTSADVLMYAAYGRLQVLGLDPYDITPAMIFREEFDPVLILTERPWQDTPSVYGPMASFSQWLAAALGGESMHHIVFWLQLIALLPFLAIALLVYRMARGDHATQTRAVLFTVLNPLMIWSVLAGAHNEAFTLLFAIVGLWFLRRHPLLAGIGIGLAGTVKVSLVFYGLAMVWGYRREPRKLVFLLVGAAIPLAIAYGVLVPRALFAAARNTGYISAGSWAPPVHGLLSLVLPEWMARSAVGWMGWLGMVAIAWMLSRVLPWQVVPGVPAGTNPRRDPLTIAVRTAAILTAAWLITSPYTLSWYDLTTWVPLGLLAASRLEPLMMWRGMWLSLAYVTGRSVEFSDGMQVASTVIRDGLCTAAQVLVIVLIVRWWWREGRELPSFTRLRATFSLLGQRHLVPHD